MSTKPKKPATSPASASKDWRKAARTANPDLQSPQSDKTTDDDTPPPSGGGGGG